MQSTCSLLNLLVLIAATRTSAAIEAGADKSSPCTHPPYKVHKVSSSPLVIYLEEFLTPPEQEHLKAVSKNKFRRSVIAGLDGAESSKIRTSQSTDVSRDSIVRCIEERALAFQGSMPGKRT